VRDVHGDEARDDRPRPEREVKPGSTTPTFGVLDIDAARRYLESKDVRFDGETYEIEGMVKLCTFYDPDGNSYMLAQSLTDEIPS
jgi:CreA protein